MSEPIKFFVEGTPSPGGSKRGFLSRYPSTKSGKHFVVMQDMGGKRTEDWRRNCAFFARQAYQGEPIEVPMMVVFEFFVTRPQGHLRSDGSVKDSAPSFPAVAPDTTKLIRSTEDALTGILWKDDSRIVRQSASKMYGDKPGCLITLWRM